MNLCAPFIRRPVMTTLLMAALLIFGLMAYRLLPVSDLPNVDYPTISVSASLPGADPQTMASSVATPLERQFAEIPGLTAMNSSSGIGSTQITLQFDLNRNIDAAAQDVQSAISAAQRLLPPQMPSPPTFRKVNPAASPVLYLSLNSATLPLSQVDEYAETNIAQRLSMVSGVAQVAVYGSQKYAVRIQLDPDAMAATGLGIDQVAQAIAQGNANQPAGALLGSHQSYTIQPDGQLTDAQAYRHLIVAYKNGAAIYLDQLGDAVDSVENTQIAGWYGTSQGQRSSIILAIERQPGTNTVQVVDDVLAQLPEVRTQIPAAVNVDVLYNRANSIRSSIDDVQFTLLLTVALVVMVIFLFLRNVAATLIPSLALPCSIVGTFAAMYLLGFSLDNLSLMALTLSTGFVVDDAIVMLENIVRRMEQFHEGPLEAALHGSREMGFTIVAMTLSLVAVFIPVLLMSGILGRLFQEFAITITVAILISGTVSLTLTPMLASRFLRTEGLHRHNRFYDRVEAVYQKGFGAYRWALQRVLRHQRATLALSGILLLLTGYLFWVVPKGLFPSQDIDMLIGSTRAVPGIPFQDMLRHQQEVVDVIAHDPDVREYMSHVGAGGPNAAGNQGIVFIHLKPASERKLSADQVIRELRPRLARIPGIMTFLMNPPVINVGGQISRSAFQLSLQGLDPQELFKVTPILMDKLRAIPGIEDVNSDMEASSPQIRVVIDRARAAALGVTATQIETALYDAYGTRQISTIYTPTNEYQVILEVQSRYQRDPAALSRLYVTSGSGTLVPLSDVANLTTGVGPVTVNHLGELPSTTISFNLKPGVALGDVTSEVMAVARADLPSDVTPSLQGQAQVFQQSLGSLGILLLVAILVIYIVLGILYESFIHPLIVLSGLPAAGLGALLTLMLFHRQLDIYAFVGLIMLIGIVKKNAIILIDFAIETSAREGKPAQEAIYEACLVRFRPIMMTTMAALMGTLPIAVGLGSGGSARQPLGLAVFGGLLVSQLLTLFITPVIYIYLDRFQQRMKRTSWLKTKLGGQQSPC